MRLLYIYVQNSLKPLTSSRITQKLPVYISCVDFKLTASPDFLLQVFTIKLNFLLITDVVDISERLKGSKLMNLRENLNRTKRQNQDDTVIQLNCFLDFPSLNKGWALFFKF